MTASDREYEALLDALEGGEAEALVCPAGHGTFPPAERCPTCGAAELTPESLPEAGRVVAATTIHTPLPTFSEDAPHVTAIASFGSVRLTGVVRGIDAELVEPGLPVEPAIERAETTDERLVAFRPR